MTKNSKKPAAEKDATRFLIWLDPEDRAKLERLAAQAKYGRVPMVDVIRSLIREAPEPKKAS